MQGSAKNSVSGPVGPSGGVGPVGPTGNLGVTGPTGPSGVVIVSGTVDFGCSASGEDNSASTTVNTSAVTEDSNILCQLSPASSADHEATDAILEGLIAYAENIVPGVSFDCVVVAPEGTWGVYNFKAYLI
jgi:hypothetical protein